MAMTDKYILVNKIAVPVDDLAEWGRWFATSDRRVAHDTVGEFRISTVFLGIDHRRGRGRGEPHLFETMVFDRKGKEQGCERCTTWEQALAQHQAVLEETRSKAFTGCSRIRKP